MGVCNSTDATEAEFPATSFVPGHVPLPPSFPAFTDDDVKGAFNRVGDVLIKDVCDCLPGAYEMPERETTWIREMLEYNVKGGKMTRGLMVVESAKLLWSHQGRQIDGDTLNKMCVLGWCIEWLQAWLLVADDFMDSSQTRRGQPCWYLKENVKTVALNDAFTIEMLVYKVLKRYFQHETYYAQLLDLFLETTFQTEVGQLADTLCVNLDIQDFTKDRWGYIVKYKTAFYSFYLPVALAMITGGVKEPEAYNSARVVLVHMGVYFQAQDDFLDAFADPETLGKIGTDIQDKKCGWLFANVFHELADPEKKAKLEQEYGIELQLTSPEQLDVLKTTYGKCAVGSPEEIAIKEMYKELKLEELYTAYESKCKVECESMVASIHPAIPKAIFEVFLKKIFKRSK